MSASLRQALESELADNPDDLATCAAYADLLEETGDPRGEYIQVQLSLEDPDLTPKRRAELTERENELWTAHGADWLGSLGPVLDSNDNFIFRRGWLHSLEVGTLSLALARALRDAPEARLLQRLEIDSVRDDDEKTTPADNAPEDDSYPAYWPLAGADNLRNVRVFRIGIDDGDAHEDYSSSEGSEAIVPIIRAMPRVEELRLYVRIPYQTELFALTTLDNLRVLKLYHCAQVHRLDILANNRHLHNLTHLLLHPHALAWRENAEQDNAAGFREQEGYLPLRVIQALAASKHFPHLAHLRLRCSSAGDEGVRVLLASSLYRQLKSLDLRHGRVTDVGANLLIASPHTRALEFLDVNSNALSADGATAIDKLGVPCLTGDQRSIEDDSYLYEADYE